MPDILALLDAAIGRLADTPTSRSSRVRWGEADAAGGAKCLNNNSVPVLPVVPVAKHGSYANTARSCITTLAPECDAPSKVSSLFTGSTGTTGSIEDFCGFQSSRNFIAHGNYGKSEPAAVRDEPIEDGIPRAWAEGLERLRTMVCPAGIRPDRWQQVIADAGRFLDQWGAQASALGWQTLDLFAAHPTHALQRLDFAGLVILLHGDELVAITADTARTRRRSGAILTYYRRPRSGGVPLWALGTTLSALVNPSIQGQGGGNHSSDAGSTRLGHKEINVMKRDLPPAGGRQDLAKKMPRDTRYKGESHPAYDIKARYEEHMRKQRAALATQAQTEGRDE